MPTCQPWGARQVLQEIRVPIKWIYLFPNALELKMKPILLTIRGAWGGHCL